MPTTHILQTGDQPVNGLIPGDGPLAFDETDIDHVGAGVVPTSTIAKEAVG